jgi:hypothetical protein
VDGAQQGVACLVEGIAGEGRAELMQPGALGLARCRGDDGDARARS